MMNATDIIRFYQLQLVKFRKLQAKNVHITEFGVRITEVLIGATERRLKELRKNRDVAVLIPIEKNGVADGRV